VEYDEAHRRQGLLVWAAVFIPLATLLQQREHPDTHPRSNTMQNCKSGLSAVFKPAGKSLCITPIED
jgi:hypothetical protein